MKTYGTETTMPSCSIPVPMVTAMYLQVILSMMATLLSRWALGLKTNIKRSVLEN